MKNEKGFTLMELLVVIVIIGLLAAVIIGALQSGRDKSVDSAIKSSLVNARTQAQLFYDRNTNSYGATTSSCAATVGTVFADPTIAAQITQVDNQNGSTTNSISCASNGASFAIASVLKTDATKAYCVDGNNAGKIVTITSGDASTAINVSSNCN
ncbi:MAG: type II secretion system protein [Minisyncoccia bacterium]